MSTNVKPAENTGRIITPQQSIPPLQLPAGSLRPSDRDYEYIHSKPATVSELEHKIRCAFMDNPVPNKHTLLDSGYDTRSATSPRLEPEHQSHVVAANQWKQRQTREPQAIAEIREHLMEKYEEEMDLWVKLMDADDPETVPISDATPFLKNRIIECLETHSIADIQKNALEDERKNRTNWLTNLILADSVYKVFKKHTLGELTKEILDYLSTNPIGTREKQFGSVSYIGRVIVTSSEQVEGVVDSYNGVTPEDVVVLSEFKESVVDAIKEYGFSFPMPMVVGHFDTSRYPLVPWTGGLACSCPFKQNAPHRVMCKHEIATAWALRTFGKIHLPVSGCNIPARSRAFVDHQIARNHVNHI